MAESVKERAHEPGGNRENPLLRLTEGALNGGGKILRIRTLMGDIEIHRADSPALEEMRQHQEAFWSHWQQYWATHCKVTEAKEEEPK